MRRSLPAHPSLAYLKHEAKDLRTGAREHETEALTTLRRLHRFTDASDTEIAAAAVTLSEAQFALALTYGFPSWPAMKRHVEALPARGGTLGRDAADPPVAMADGTTALDGLQRARWGHATRRQSSVIATLALVSERLGDDSDYDYLMGASAAAFRVQMAEGRFCPSSPHASCGFDCGAVALRIWGRDVTFWKTDEKHSDQRSAARARAIESLDRGIPVLWCHEENSLVVGYQADALLLRRYSAPAEGYESAVDWPWMLGVPSGERRVPAPDAALAESLRLAVELFDTPTVGRYTSGSAAYRHWSELLSDDDAFAKRQPQELFVAALGHAVTFDGLMDARGAAVNYLTTAAETYTAAAEPLGQAALAYGRLEQLLHEQRRELARYPWELGDFSEWSPALRRRQAELLREASVHDAAAVRFLREARDALEVASSATAPS
jgi:hypothetical protein